MSLFSIADLHLSGSSGENKSMEIFGRRWIGGIERLTRQWSAIITDNDHVVIPGDISWAMTLEEAAEDFELINSLPGIKYIGKGNHDFWWTTASKMNAFFNDRGFDTLNILYNNSYVTESTVICGSRGWFPDENNQKTVGDVSWQKIIDRETSRIKLSLESSKDAPPQLPRLVFLHFPPVWNGIVCRGIIDVLHQYDIRRCYFGHIHGYYFSDADFIFEGISFEMISADYLNFCPKKLSTSSKTENISSNY